ncbi:unnamed protein product [Enterobius vermicularis]|uniref:FAD_binding_2 domain-containing protein n=1 Tax=Enterobius vermicularis TaxID=51028 RepID=A0A0N4VAV0_ENTVE|nr:unnamed protein product [Enterobius vermicularis]
MKDALCPYFMQIYVETPIFVHAATVVCTMAFLDLSDAIADGQKLEERNVSDHWKFGGLGALDLAEAVVKTCKLPSKGESKKYVESEYVTNVRGNKELIPEVIICAEGCDCMIWRLRKTLGTKTAIIARKMFGAVGVELLESAGEEND